MPRYERDTKESVPLWLVLTLLGFTATATVVCGILAAAGVFGDDIDGRAGTGLGFGAAAVPATLIGLGIHKVREHRATPTISDGDNISDGDSELAVLKL